VTAERTLQVAGEEAEANFWLSRTGDAIARLEEVEPTMSGKGHLIASIRERWMQRELPPNGAI
jgi:hypothetical protein